MAESDSLIEVLKEIRDEIRAVRTELGDRGAPAASGIRTAVVERGARWRIGATAGIGAVALVALVLALRAGGPTSPAVVAAAPQMAPATMTASTAMTTTPVPSAMPAPAPTAMPAPVATKTPPPASATNPAATRPAVAQQPAGAPAVAAVPKRHVKPAVALKLPTAVASDERRDDGVLSAAAARARPQDVVRPGRLGTGEALARSRSRPRGAGAVGRRRVGVGRRASAEASAPASTPAQPASPSGASPFGQTHPQYWPGIGRPVSSARPNPHPRAAAAVTASRRPMTKRRTATSPPTGS